jgi:hypothetical protein
MKHGRNSLAAKRPRYHPGLAWEANNLTNEFIDINRLALDDDYGHVGASLSKRRRGIGPTDGKTPGLFGIGGVIDYKTKTTAFNTGVFSAILAYSLVDYYLNKGHGLAGMQRRIARWPMGLVVLGLSYAIIQPNN